MLGIALFSCAIIIKLPPISLNLKISQPIGPVDLSGLKFVQSRGGVNHGARFVT